MKLEQAVAAGITGPEFTFPVETGKVREFARAIGATAPEHFREQQALAPAYFLVSALFFWGYTLETPGDSAFADLEIDRSLLLHAAEEVEFPNGPPHSGEILHARSRISEVYERFSKRSGRLLFVVTETEFRDGNHELRARHRGTLVLTGTPPAEDRAGAATQ